MKQPIKPTDAVGLTVESITFISEGRCIINFTSEEYLVIKGTYDQFDDSAPDVEFEIIPIEAMLCEELIGAGLITAEEFKRLDRERYKRREDQQEAYDRRALKRLLDTYGIPEDYQAS